MSLATFCKSEVINMECPWQLFASRQLEGSNWHKKTYRFETTNDLLRPLSNIQNYIKKI